MSKRKAPDSGTDTNKEICDMLIELANYEKNVHRAIHKYNAYRKAAAAISKHPEKITSGKQAKALDGVGEKIAKKIQELLDTGQLNKLEKIRKDDTSVAIQDLVRVSGIGPVFAHQLVKDDINSVEDLKKHEGRLNHHQKIGLKYVDDFDKRIPREEMEEIEKAAFGIIDELDDKYMAMICGSYRRGAKSSGDIDILLTHPSFTSKDDKKKSKVVENVVKALEDGGLVTDVISKGPTKFMGVCKLKDHSVYRRIDISLFPCDQYWCGVLHFTGSDEFNREIRAKALEKGFKLNELCLIKTSPPEDKVIPIGSEKDVFKALGMEYVEPKNRSL